jgi:hypothetical protein
MGLGSELVTNGDFAAWSTDDPVGWAVNAEDGTNYVTEHANGAQIVSDGTLLQMSQTMLTVGKSYRVIAVVHTVTLGSVSFQNTSGTPDAITVLSLGTNIIPLIAGSTSIQLKRTGACNIIVASVSIREVKTGMDMEMDMSM